MDDRSSIAKIYNISVEDLTNYLSILANYRNVCAHEDILFENKTQKSINNTVYHALLGIKNKTVNMKRKNDLFALIIILRQILGYEDVKNLILELDRALENLRYNLHTIELEKY